MTIHYSAPCLFGLESVLAGEIRRMGGEAVAALDGRVDFSGGIELLARGNLWLRTAERLLVKLGEFPAHTFEELFQGVKALPLEDWIGRQDAFPVKGHCVRSALHSVPDCQKIVKKAAVERLKEKYGVSWFEETGPIHQLRFTILKDRAAIFLDTSGEGLHKRGYRRESGGAPIKETLAAGMLDLAFVKRDTLLADPFCGSGTILIEGALRALGIAPGLRRRFAAEHWRSAPDAVWREERARAVELSNRQPDAKFRAVGYDIDPAMVELTLLNARKAGIADRLSVSRQDVRFFKPPEGAVIVTNPPYGERLLDKETAAAITGTMGKVFTKGKAGYYIISPDENFEAHFGRRANKRRRLYNGMLRCELYSFYPPRPGKQDAGGKPLADR